MIGELVKVAGQCDGVRCDMTMLVLPDVFGHPGAFVLSHSGPERSSERESTSQASPDQLIYPASASLSCFLTHDCSPN